MTDGFTLTLPVNYEDTDAGGVVYHANYLKYMERARNAWLRQLGFALTELHRRQGVWIVTTEVSVKYLSAAGLDDEIEVTVTLLRSRRASAVFSQQVRRGGHVLVDAEITLATVNSDTFAPCRIPPDLAAALNGADR